MGTTRRAVAGLTTFLVTGLLLGCGDVARESTGPGPSASALLDVSASSATTVTTNLQIPTTLLVFVACANGGAGELILVEGDLHVLFHTTISNSGNVHLDSHFQPMGISGAGLSTGDKYQATGVTQSHDNLNGPLPITSTIINNFRMIGQGPGNNFLVHETLHITVNANGQVTALVNNVSIECK